MTSFFTYFGQFLDHDMTLDTLPLPTEFVDPNTIPNIRDPRLNLDSVYGVVRRRTPNCTRLTANTSRSMAATFRESLVCSSSPLFPP